MDKHWTVYMYTFPNGKRYVGATSLTLTQRQGHQFKRYENCKELWDAITEFGYNNIEQEILFEGNVSEKEIAEQERRFIAEYNTNNPNLGYNKSPGGEGLYERHYTDEYASRRNEMIRQVAYGNKGRKHTAESKAKMRAAKLGKKRGPMSAETKAKISRANSRENMSEETHMRRVRSKQKKVLATNNATGEQIVFDSCMDVANHFGVGSSSVSRWVRGTRRPNNGYSFQFLSPTTTE